MTGQTVRKTITIGYGPLALVLLATLSLGLLAGALLGAVGSRVPPNAPASPVTRPPQGAWLGITYVPITVALAQLYGLPVNNGALIVAVSAGSPAARAGLREDDIVTAAGQKTIDDRTSLMDVMKGSKPGDHLHLAVVREGNDMSIDVVIGRLPGTGPAQDAPPLERFFNELFGRIRGN